MHMKYGTILNKLNDINIQFNEILYVKKKNSFYTNIIIDRKIYNLRIYTKIFFLVLILIIYVILKYI
ncbi:unnamed protein product [Rotaria sordida]|uniref:Uncharacterized protein n=1 Tax=Rotaria sordida TaxID=392033 RepID=A0A814EZV9_9BILA|nr:unnamed protein product [Rotaria sordida]CAF1086003.1 unnamed protein product [Rotaria sordida]